MHHKEVYGISSEPGIKSRALLLHLDLATSHLSCPPFLQSTDLICICGKKQSAWQKGNGSLIVTSGQKRSAAVTNPASRNVSGYATCQELGSLPALEIHGVWKIISMMRRTEGLNKDMWWHLNKNAFAFISYTFFIKMRQLNLIFSRYFLFYFCTNEKIQLKYYFPSLFWSFQADSIIKWTSHNKF